MRYQYYYQPQLQERTYNMRIGDRPTLEARLVKDEDGTSVDLTSSTGYILIKDSGDSQVVSGALSIYDAPNGRVRYTLGATELSSIGKYSCEFYVSINNDNIYISLPEGGLEYIVNVS